MNLFSEETRRNPYPVYDQLRRDSPVLHVPSLNLWMIFDYDGVKRALTDLLERLKDLELASQEPWQPRQALHVHCPTHLPIRFPPGTRQCGDPPYLRLRSRT